MSGKALDPGTAEKPSLLALLNSAPSTANGAAVAEGLVDEGPVDGWPAQPRMNTSDGVVQMAAGHGDRGKAQQHGDHLHVETEKVR